VADKNVIITARNIGDLKEIPTSIKQDITSNCNMMCEVLQIALQYHASEPLQEGFEESWSKDTITDRIKKSHQHSTEYLAAVARPHPS